MRRPGQPTAAPANGSLLLLPHELGTVVGAYEEDTMSRDTQRQRITEKLRSLPPERVAEVEDFIDVCLSLENLIDPMSPFIQRSAKEVDAPDEESGKGDPEEIPKLRAKQYMEEYINPPEFVERQRKRMVEEKKKKKKGRG